MQGAKVIVGYGKEVPSLQEYKNNFQNHIDFTIKSQMVGGALPPIFCTTFNSLCSWSVLDCFFKSTQNIAELSAIMWSLIAIIPLIIAIIRARVTLNIFLPSYEQLLDLNQDAKKFNCTKW